MIENALATSSDEHLLETGGMVYIAAEADGKPLELVKGKTMNIQMPLINSLENNKGMELFYGETHAQTSTKNGVKTNETKPIARINWKPTKQKMRSRSKFAKRVKWDKIPKPAFPSTNFAMIYPPKLYEPSRMPHFPRELPNPALQKRSFFARGQSFGLARGRYVLGRVRSLHYRRRHHPQCR